MQIPNENSRKLELSIQGKKVSIRSFLSPDEIAGLSFNNSMTGYTRYRPIVSGKKALIHAASIPDVNVTLAIGPDRMIIGLGVLEYPLPEARWKKVGERVMMEVAAIEVSIPWRSLGLSKDILRLLVNHPLRDERIFYMVGYSWTWDIDGKDLSAMGYRNMLINLFSREGFRIYQTNEPNVMLRSENLFMARVGANISETVQKRFKQVRFGLDPEL